MTEVVGIPIIQKITQKFRKQIPMNQEESIALYEQGKDAWNKWAKGMLAEYDKLQASKKWPAQREDWWRRAKADFYNHSFPESVDFRGAIFPGEANFANTHFKNNAWFMGAQFQGITDFIDAHFEQIAEFGHTKFQGETNFIDARFHGYAEFGGATFEEDTLFTSAVMKSSMTLIGTIFFKEIDFKNITVEDAFTMQETTFYKLPDFRQAQFQESPDLVSLVILETPSETAETAAKYRALKKLAIQAHDHEQEINFFAGELEAKGSFFGKLYEVFSDFGRSLSMPLLAWSVTTLYAMMGYHSLSVFGQIGHTPSTCSKMADAFELAIRKGLLALG